MSEEENVKGVEVNEFSRFVDHTLATSWESLIADIEKSLRMNRDLFRKRIEFSDLSLVLEKSYDQTHYFDSEKDWIRSMLHIQEYLLLYPSLLNDPQNCDHLRSTILSAFTIALKSTVVNCPIFFSIEDMSSDNFERVSNTTGYRCLQSSEELEHSQASSHRQQLWVRYESSAYYKLHSRHSLYFFDGIKKLFQRKMRSLSLHYTYPQMLENFITSVIYTYQYTKSIWELTSAELRTPSREVIDYQRVSTESPFSALLIKSVNYRQRFSNLLKELFYAHTDEAIISNSLSTACFGNFFPTVELSKLQMKVYFDDLKQATVIDNDTYSTFLPSKQLPHQWSVFPLFRHVSEKSNIPSGPENPFPKAVWKSYLFRRVLCCYIYMAYSQENCPSKSTIPVHLPDGKSTDKADLAKNESEYFVFDDLQYFLLNKQQNDSLQDCLSKLQPSTSVLFQSIFPEYMLVSNLFEQQEAISPVMTFSANKSIQETVRSFLLHPDGNNDSEKTASEGLKCENPTSLTNIERWFQLFSICVGLLPCEGPYVLTFWHELLRELQNKYDTNEQFPWNEVGAYATASTINENNTPLYGQSLWEDCENAQNLLPDLHKSIIIQKFSMLQFCQTVKNMSIIREQTEIISPSLNSNGKSNNISILRRVPSTSDRIAMQKHMLEKFSLQKSKTLMSNPLLKLQLQLPNLINDIQSFKYYSSKESSDSLQGGSENEHGNNNHDDNSLFQRFCTWYGVQDFIDNYFKYFGDIDDDADASRFIMTDLYEIWKMAQPFPCEKQKVLFSPYKEVDKAIDFIERMNMRDILLESIHYILLFIQDQFEDEVKLLRVEVDRLRQKSLEEENSASERYDSFMRGHSQVLSISSFFYDHIESKYEHFKTTATSCLTEIELCRASLLIPATNVTSHSRQHTSTLSLQSVSYDATGSESNSVSSPSINSPTPFVNEGVLEDESSSVKSVSASNNQNDLLNEVDKKENPNIEKELISNIPPLFVLKIIEVFNQCVQATEELELSILKYQQLFPFIFNSFGVTVNSDSGLSAYSTNQLLSILNKWLRNDEYHCEQEFEVAYLHNLMKEIHLRSLPTSSNGIAAATSNVTANSSMSNIMKLNTIDSSSTLHLLTKQSKNDWYSRDGRELGFAPHMKHFVLNSFKNPELIDDHYLRKINESKQAHYRTVVTENDVPAIALDFADELDESEVDNFSKDSYKYSQHNGHIQMPQSDICMRAVTDGKSIRVIYEILENS